MNKVLENLEAIRAQKGIKQEVIAERLGVSQQAYSGYFTTTGDMKISRIQEIADILGVSLVDVITYPEKYVPESTIPQECDGCRKKQETIDNLNELLRVYRKQSKK